MNFLHLKYFLLVAEELNITRAAERLYISQQSLSNHISNMERELDVKLFTRSPKLSLTHAGDLLVETATQILDLHSQYLAKVGDFNRDYMGVLRLGISHTCGLALLPEVLPKFQAEFPMVEFSLFEGKREADGTWIISGIHRRHNQVVTTRFRATLHIGNQPWDGFSLKEHQHHSRKNKIVFPIKCEVIQINDPCV